MKYYHQQTIYKNDHISLGTLIDLMATHADRSARGMKSKWVLQMQNGNIVVFFALRDDWRFFGRTFLAEHRVTLERNGLLAPTHDPARRQAA